MKTQNDVVALHKAGSTDPESLDELIAAAWSGAVNDPADQAELEAILGLTQEQLKTAPPPFRSELITSGLTGAEVAIVFAAAFVTAYAKKLGTAAGNAVADFTVQKAREIWPIIKRRMFRSEAEVLGPELDQPGD